MMHGTITDDQARALAEFIRLVRGWDVPGIRAAIHEARSMADAHGLAIALIEYAKRTDVKTPGLFAQDGPHWHTGRTPNARVTPAKCERHPHSLLPCRECEAERKGYDEPPDSLEVIGISAEQAERNARGAAEARARLKAALRGDHTAPPDETYTDGRMLAAGEGRE